MIPNCTITLGSSDKKTEIPSSRFENDKTVLVPFVLDFLKNLHHPHLYQNDMGIFSTFLDKAISQGNVHQLSYQLRNLPNESSSYSLVNMSNQPSSGSLEDLSNSGSSYSLVSLPGSQSSGAAGDWYEITVSPDDREASEPSETDEIRSASEDGSCYEKESLEDGSAGPYETVNKVCRVVNGEPLNFFPATPQDPADPLLDACFVSTHVKEVIYTDSLASIRYQIKPLNDAPETDLETSTLEESHFT